MNYIGKCCYHSTVEKFLALGEQEWLQAMSARFKRVSAFGLRPEQERAWKNCYAVMAAAFRQLPEEYGKLQIIFEYVLPLRRPGDGAAEEDPGVRADVVLLSKDTVAVFEFKDRDALYPGCERQARKYARRLKRWHTGSIGMRRKTAVVLPQAPRTYEKRYRLALCSGDTVVEAVKEFFPAPLRRMPQSGVKEWMRAEWAVAKKYRNAEKISGGHQKDREKSGIIQTMERSTKHETEGMVGDDRAGTQGRSGENESCSEGVYGGVREGNVGDDRGPGRLSTLASRESVSPERPAQGRERGQEQRRVRQSGT